MNEAQSDLLYGVEAIARHLGIRKRQAYSLHETRAIPTFKIGARVCARRSDLDAWLEEQAKGARA